MRITVTEVKVLPVDVAILMIDKRGYAYVIQDDQLYRIYPKLGECKLIFPNVIKIENLKENEIARLWYFRAGVFLGEARWTSHSPIVSIEFIKPMEIGEKEAA